MPYLLATRRLSVFPLSPLLWRSAVQKIKTKPRIETQATVGSDTVRYKF